jgi:hypothetical protein
MEDEMPIEMKGPWAKAKCRDLNDAEKYAYQVVDRSKDEIAFVDTGDSTKNRFVARLIVRLANLYFAGQEAEVQQDKAIRARGDLPPDRGYGLSEGEQAASLMMNGLLAENDALLSLVQRFVALPSGAWHPERHAAEEAELVTEARAAIAKAEGE